MKKKLGGKPTIRQRELIKARKGIAQHILDIGWNRVDIAWFLGLNPAQITRMQLIDKKHDNEKAN